LLRKKRKKNINKINKINKYFTKVEEKCSNQERKDLVSVAELARSIFSVSELYTILLSLTLFFLFPSFSFESSQDCSR